MKTSLMSGVNPRAKVVDVDWTEFVALVNQCSIPRKDTSDDEKKNSPSFSCVEYSPPNRSLANIKGRLWALVLDLDSISDPGRVMEALVDYRYIAWTTWSSTIESPAWRIVLPVRGGLSPDQLKLGVRLLGKMLGRSAKIDDCSKDAAHLWFLPWHKHTSRESHSVWDNEGQLLKVSEKIVVDFTGVPSSKPENVGEGGRNVALHRFLGTATGLRCSSRLELLKLAMEFNSRLKHPMSRAEVRATVSKKWAWMTTTPVGIRERSRVASKSSLDEARANEVGQLFSMDGMARVIVPDPLVGNFLYPGVTLITAKMKEGKSFLVAQLASAIATGTPFLEGPAFPGYAVRHAARVAVFAGEDTPWLIAQRYARNMRSGKLPRVEDGMIRFVFPEDLQRLRSETADDVSGLILLESLIEKWYADGVRVVFLDPLRVVEGMLGISVIDYPGGRSTRNIHTHDLLTTAYFQRLASRLDGMCILLTLHHGKSKRDHNANDPGDMVAGTTGLGAGAGATISLLPVPRILAGDEDGEEEPLKRRELYLHGRVVRESRMLLEQDDKTGLWRCLGAIRDVSVTESRERYMEALKALNGASEWVTAGAIAERLKVKEGTIHKVFSRAIREGIVWGSFRLISSRSQGYKLSRVGPKPS